MIKIFSYLKNSKAMVLAIILLLIVQAGCDLSLPQYTSDIVDVGIQQGGIERATPDRMRKETYENLCLFMTDAEIETIEPYYVEDEEGSYVLNTKMRKFWSRWTVPSECRCSFWPRWKNPERWM